MSELRQPAGRACWASLSGGHAAPALEVPQGSWRIRPMQTRRGFLIKVAVGFAAMAMVVVGTVLADELLGVITKVDIEGKQITVEEKDTDKEVKIKITDDTKQVTKNGEVAVDLEKLDGFVKKSQDNGKKGVNAKIYHEKRVATKIEFQKKKKAAN
jgi:hypothetical protein